MGLLDKYIEMTAGPAPDMPALIGGLLDAGDTFLSWTTAVPEAYERGGGGGTDPINRLLSKAVNAALTAHAQDKHISGPKGSIARTLPCEGEPLILVVSTAGLSAWKGNGYRGNIPKPFYRIAAEHISTVTDTAQRGQGGTRIYRVDFVDNSFFDYRVMTNHDEFLAACIQRWSAV